MTARPLPPLLLRGDCIARMRDLPDASIDAIVTDPPYGLEFMGREWDGADGFRRALNPADAGRDNAFGRASRTSPEYRAGHLFEEWTSTWAAEALRVLKPGGHLLAFGGSRTWHRLAAGIEDAGFEIRDSIAWLYGSGFPKSLDVSKAIDKAAGAERTRSAGPSFGSGGNFTDDNGTTYGTRIDDDPATPEAAAWQGWGTALKPAFEPIVVARKPLAGTVAANVLRHGTGALNIDASRIGHTSEADRAESEAKNRHATFGSGPRENQVYGKDERARGESGDYSGAAGRWPANVMLDEGQAAALDAQTGTLRTQATRANPKREGGGGMFGLTGGGERSNPGAGEVGGASRFFYVAKAPKSERPVTVDDEGRRVAHPTVKPLALTRYLVTLVTPPGGVVLDPFAGSGTTLEAAYACGFESIGVELTPDYWPLIEARIDRAVGKGPGS